ncbi:MAG: hypothetical protein HC904_11010, partial [Blastochloris sp.]|nr:hypothetical protein [Blastochloris sp.]
ELTHEVGVAMPELKLSSEINSPMLVGLIRKTIILPYEKKIPDEILRHELTHLKNNDVFWHYLSVSLSRFFPLQISFRWIKKSLNELAEERCDAYVLQAGGNRQNYAKILVEMAEKQIILNNLCLQMAEPSMLEKRVRRLLTISWVPERKVPLTVALITMLGMGLAVLAAGWVLFGLKIHESDKTTLIGNLANKHIPIEGEIIDPILTRPNIQNLNSGFDRSLLIKKIEVEYAGKPDLPKEEIIKMSGLKINEPYHYRMLQLAVKRLYESGKFEDLRIYDNPLKGGVEVVIIVQPIFTIKKLVWVGFNDDTHRALEKKLSTKEGGRLSGRELHHDLSLIREQLPKDRIVVSKLSNVDDQNSLVDVIIELR